MERPIECRACGGEFIPSIENHKIVRDNQTTGIVAVFGERNEAQLYDAFDCPYCGCQVIQGKRKREVNGTYITKEDAETLEEILCEEDTDDSHNNIDRYPGETSDIEKAIEESGEKTIPLYYEKSPLQEQAEQEELADTMKEWEQTHKESMLEEYNYGVILKIYKLIYNLPDVTNRAGILRSELISEIVKDTDVECDDITQALHEIFSEDDVVKDENLVLDEDAMKLAGEMENNEDKEE